jgi:hypothetical protein
MSTPYPPSAMLEWVQTASRGCDCPLCLHASQLGTAGPNLLYALRQDVISKDRKMTACLIQWTSNQLQY